MSATAAEPLLRVTDLHQRFSVPRGTVHAVSGVSLELRHGETLGLVGESGCGKSTTGRAILQLPPPTSGSVAFDGEELTGRSAKQLRPVRRRLQAIFQDPRSVLNPRRKVRDVVGEGLAIQGVDTATARERVDQALLDVGLDPAQVGDRRPGEFSGGQCQRIAIARAMVLQPELLICDEPVSALDVSVQAQVLNVLATMRRERSLAMLLIAHDLAVVRAFSDRVAVMYLGRIVEVGDAESIYTRPAHPYTRALVDSVPQPDPRVSQEATPSLHGELPSPLNPPSGCRFRTRCPLATGRCAEVEPELTEVAPGQSVACHYPLHSERPSPKGVHV
ncbi:MAG TPA: oligopeptide/dipeptide ABC transporter ATP-binding protein [Actinomycetaceae bacterium]|nr:oligopeptide/dipeptide ABC transporter ATP-binding protein [Actinomycetaceae bacterium]